jgi:hypothetical protein
MTDQNRQFFESSRAAFEARTDYQDLVAQAAELGYRRITLYEQMNPGSADAYSWRGGVWVPIDRGNHPLSGQRSGEWPRPPHR